MASVEVMHVDQSEWLGRGAPGGAWEGHCGLLDCSGEDVTGHIRTRPSTGNHPSHGNPLQTRLFNNCVTLCPPRKCPSLFLVILMLTQQIQKIKQPWWQKQMPSLGSTTGVPSTKLMIQCLEGPRRLLVGS